MTLPYIFVCDWDGTIAGRVDFQSQQFILHNALKQSGFKPIKQNKIPPAFYPNAKLIRPGITSFIKAMQELYDNKAYFFIYTGSEKTWAMQEVAWVEETHGIKFMRPIFTRDDCIVDSHGNVRKSLNKIMPRMLRVVAPNIPARERAVIIQNNVMIIDNNSVYLDNTDKLLLCPDYGYMFFENLLHGIPAEARKHPNIDRYILGFINQGLLCPHLDTRRVRKDKDKHKEPPMDGMKQLAKQYKWLALKCKTISEMNEKYSRDQFWYQLRKLIVENNIRTYSPTIVINLQNTIWKTQKV